MCHNGAIRHTTTLLLNPKKSFLPEARAGIALRSRQAVLRRIRQGTFKPPSKNPAAAAKIRQALLLRIQQGKWKRPTPPERDPKTGRWMLKSEPY